MGDLDKKIQRRAKTGRAPDPRADPRRHRRGDGLRGLVELPLGQRAVLDPPAGLPRRLLINRPQHPPNIGRQILRIPHRPQPRPRHILTPHPIYPLVRVERPTGTDSGQIFPDNYDRSPPLRRF